MRVVLSLCLVICVSWYLCLVNCVCESCERLSLFLDNFISVYRCEFVYLCICVSLSWVHNLCTFGIFVL